DRVRVSFFQTGSRGMLSGGQTWHKSMARRVVAGTRCAAGLRGVGMGTVNVAIVGCGYIGTRHAQSLAHLSGAKVVAFVDQDLNRAKELRQTHGEDDAGAKTDIAA